MKTAMHNNETFKAELVMSKDMIHDYMGIIAKHGFKYIESQVGHNDLTGDSIQFSFVCKATGLTMEINYNPSLNNMRRRFSVTLEKNSELERLYLDQYLKTHNRNDLLTFFMDVGRTLEMRPFWDGFFKVIDLLFTNELKEIISGKKWDNTPVDWDGYR